MDTSKIKPLITNKALVLINTAENPKEPDTNPPNNGPMIFPRNLRLVL